ncbi:hypothetical protein [Arthrobacter sp. D2-10]
MSGLKLVLPTTFTDVSLPVLRDDPVLSNGSLLLLDPSHPAAPWAAGVPASGSLLNNVASAEAESLLSGDLRPTLSYTPSMNDGVKGKMERTGKGGLHTIISRSTPLASGDGASILMAPAVENYLAANKSHAFYLSFWDRMTRVNGGTVGSNGVIQYGVVANDTNNLLAAFRADVWFIFGSTGGNRMAPNAVGPRLGNAQVDAGKATINAANINSAGPIWGAPAASYNNAVLSSRNGHWPSFAFYRFYLEDLTVSGRTYGEVDAIDNAEHTKQVLTPGGRYYADTFTDPTTIP